MTRPSETSLAIRVRRAEPADALELARLAARTFSETFGPGNTPENLALHLERSYGERQQAAELTNPAMTTLLALRDEVPVGYAQLRTGSSPGSAAAGRQLELMRFYVDSRWHGRGVAQQLMQSVLETAQGAGARSLWLGVWEKNPRAIAFYEKCGFVSSGRQVFCLGTDEQLDLVMVRAL